jgi:D-alanine-D-alanine ligase-like ATP-grasp enzyme
MKRVGILRGGTGKHYTSSLKKGGEIISHIFENLQDKYKIVDILIDKDYIWHVNGVPINTGDLVHKVDIVWNATHPSFSNILESLSIPNIGAGSFSSAFKNSREMLKEHMKKIGVNMPRSIILPIYQKDFSAQDGSASGGEASLNKYAIKKAKEVFEKFGAPWIVKSFTPDSNMAIHLAKTFNELVADIEDGVEHDKSILVEEFIIGKMVSLHSVRGFRGQDIYIFPIGNMFDDLSELSSKQGEFYRVSFSSLEKEKLTNLVKDLHDHIDAKHYLKSNFVLNPRGKIYLTQIELAPDLRTGSHFSQVCESVGVKMHQVVEHILEQAK